MSPVPQVELTLLRELATGTFARLYLAQARRAGVPERMVAVKILREQWNASPDLLARTGDEARLLGRLRHRHIVRVEDTASIDGQFAILMEYVEGLDLKQLIEAANARGLTMPARAAVQVAFAVASALEAAHHRVPQGLDRPLRVVHRDIKPSNIMVAADGEVKVLDFGTARYAEEARAAQTREMRFGSLKYMSPERRDGDRGELPSDVYALGLVLIEILRGGWLPVLPLDAQEHDEAIAEYVEQLPSGMMPDDAWDQGFRQLLCRLCAADATWRPEARDVVRLLAAYVDQALGDGVDAFAAEVVVPALAAARAAPPKGELAGRCLTVATRVLESDPRLADASGTRPRPPAPDASNQGMAPVRPGAGQDAASAPTPARPAADAPTRPAPEAAPVAPARTPAAPAPAAATIGDPTRIEPAAVEESRSGPAPTERVHREPARADDGRAEPRTNPSASPPPDVRDGDAARAEAAPAAAPSTYVLAGPGGGERPADPRPAEAPARAPARHDQPPPRPSVEPLPVRVGRMVSSVTDPPSGPSAPSSRSGDTMQLPTPPPGDPRVEPTIALPEEPPPTARLEPPAEPPNPGASGPRPATPRPSRAGDDPSASSARAARPERAGRGLQPVLTPPADGDASTWTRAFAVPLPETARRDEPLEPPVAVSARSQPPPPPPARGGPEVVKVTPDAARRAADVAAVDAALASVGANSRSSPTVELPVRPAPRPGAPPTATPGAPPAPAPWTPPVATATVAPTVPPEDPDEPEEAPSSRGYLLVVVGLGALIVFGIVALVAVLLAVFWMRTQPAGEPDRVPLPEDAASEAPAGDGAGAAAEAPAEGTAGAAEGTAGAAEGTAGAAEAAPAGAPTEAPAAEAPATTPQAVDVTVEVDGLRWVMLGQNGGRLSQGSRALHHQAPPGEYELTVSVVGRPLARGTLTVGDGPVQLRCLPAEGGGLRCDGVGGPVLLGP